MLFVAAAVLIAALAGAGLWLRSEIDAPYYDGQEEGTFVEIPRGTNPGRAADLLVGSGVLRARLPFVLYIRYANLGRRLQAGEYRFSGPATPKQVAQRLVRGDVYSRTITIPEGLTAKETIELLAKHGLGNRQELEETLLRRDWIRDLDPAARNLEGYLFPETYRFSRKADAETIVKTMVDQFRTKLARTMEANPLPPGWSISRIVILASMIEKEVKEPEEAPLVASALVNRLDRKMPLGCDATIIYAMKLAGTYQGRLGKADMGMASPYNTYLHLNLPPGPICNPGAGSLRAALRPAKTDYLYSVSRNDGTHQFSRDFNSHVRAVERYQKSLVRSRSRQ